ncbi:MULTISPECIES: 2-dehydro-3-deoxygalactonokinase [unclassified Avibacterium]|uniref:2-dehydro-3-deoxygalactonokinase n=1 Tax=unclassified Avibacterium TaxID=2685287 RepID=UPI0020273B37|nr:MULTISPECIES: 2-dehydro-3-deoxygalactonokinase [unclassified Avibacterium]MCW9699797.1 2-dehydro-3-deoxygalactonokinase [Avibacterium sp. 20-129]URL06415.1 2-dehydro-3-deoxygalactonokinase [Avibacterium sp. 21-595]
MENWIAVDWGTTNFRAYFMDHEMSVIDRIDSDQGLLSIKEKDFADTLLNNIQQWQCSTDLASTPIYMAGMVGSKQGWKEANYLSMPLNLSEIPHHLLTFKLPWEAPAFIVPGISGMNKLGMYDVMRGEETQLLGLQRILNQENIAAILPGTHSKQVVIEKGKMNTFISIMTGELFSLLNQHSILTKDVPQKYDDHDSFLFGVKNGYNYPLNAILFSARTLSLNSMLSPTQIRSYLSGLLIGNEINLLGEYDQYYIIGNSTLSQKYLDASLSVGKKAEIIDGEQCFIKGISYIHQHTHN